MQYNCGIFITRAQPFHKGHLMIVNQILNENDKCLIILGSANKQGTLRNPFDGETRKRIIITGLTDYGIFDTGRISILPLPDWSMEDAYCYVKEWGSYLYYNTVAAIEQKTFNLYYNDDPSIVNEWFLPDIAQRVTIKTFDRNADNNPVYGISSTKVREAVVNNDMEYLNRALTDGAVREMMLLRDTLIRINSNPGEDFIMQ